MRLMRKRELRLSSTFLFLVNVTVGGEKEYTTVSRCEISVRSGGRVHECGVEKEEMAFKGAQSGVGFRVLDMIGKRLLTYTVWR